MFRLAERDSPFDFKDEPIVGSIMLDRTLTFNDADFLGVGRFLLGSGGEDEESHGFTLDFFLPCEAVRVFGDFEV